MADYTVTMTLMIEFDDVTKAADARAYLDTIWPIGNRSRWENIDFNDMADDAALRAAINTKITKELTSVVTGTTIPMGAAIQNPFPTSVWRVGPGGVHEGKGRISYKSPPSAPYATDWEEPFSSIMGQMIVAVSIS